MSRIDEALRRASGLRPAVPARGASGASGAPDLFVSPWDFERETATGAESVETVESEPDSGARSADAPAAATPAAATGLSDTWRQRLVLPTSDPGLVEQFRRLAAALIHGRRDGKLSTIMVTSAVPGEGKTLTTLNLGLVLSESYRRRVLIVDADLRRPRLSEALDVTGAGGLGDALRANAEKKVALVQLTENLTLMPAGPPEADPLSVLTSARMQRLLSEAAEQFDWVIIDTPPIGAAADAGLLCPIVDASILVVRAGKTPYVAVQRAVQALGRDRIFGVVLNGVTSGDGAAYGEYASEHTAG